jgi:hypothetical protein
LLQRQLGKMIAAYNRVVRGKAQKEENERFDTYAQAVQKIVDDAEAETLDVAALRLGDMRNLFFTIAWRDPDYVLTWFRRLSNEPFLFPNQEDFKAMVAEGDKLRQAGDQDGLRDLVGRMLDARIALGASDVANELATIVKT